MMDIKILQFLALSAFMLACSEAHYPYGQQHYGNHNNNYNNVHNGNYNSLNNNNYNNNYNNNIDNNVNNGNHNNQHYSNNNNSNENPNNRRSSNNKNNNIDNSPVLAINLPKIYLGDFEYKPTRDGYRFSYQLIDGTRRTEIGFLPIAANSGAYMQDERATAERSAIRMRARANSKNRKLSPKSLQSLAG
ncbi:uncharacterized protein DDB_G0289917 [Ceratitis capitata]|nr:uncharacterized protein DDB_G0289917 [Ceratitis capitata]